MISDRTRWMLATSLSATAAAFLTRSVLKKGWTRVTGNEPPLNPASSETAWTEALIWTAAAGAVAGLSRVTARRTAAGVLDGSDPR